ncbi:MAG TPA: tRNA dihydrouridine(20/20a) synthase DusA [Steroidobacteraceae bacterium]|nr:tRNA dihydrouridine(20/20a) synthase DusA [Steroidobacteraceae bacterium]
MTEIQPNAATGTTKSVQAIDRRLSVAPMMDWTDRHCRYFLRGFSPSALLYTEMITAEALLRGDVTRLLQHAPEEQPLALQLGGSSPERLAAAARLGEKAGYVEINLNCGCPSDRVHAGSFGACLMAVPARVADCVAAMLAAVTIPVTVKMRIGVIESGTAGPLRERLATYDEQDYARLVDFTATVSAGGCATFIVHARQAVLGGLSPKENRDVPPLRPQIVRQLAEQFPRLQFVLNGGLRTAAEAVEALAWCKGIMLGREAYHRPYLLSELEQQVFSGHWQRPQESALLERMAAYAERELAAGTALAAVTRHMLGLYAGQPGARGYRQRLTEGARRAGAGAEVVRAAAGPSESQARIPVGAQR